jgi:hypothetical protein
VELPLAGEVFLQNRQRVTGAGHWFFVWAGDGDFEVGTHPGPVAVGLNFFDVALAVDLHVFHGGGLSGEGLFAEGFAARDHEEGVVGHKVEDGGGVAGFGGGHPGGDELANGLFVL